MKGSAVIPFQNGSASSSDSGQIARSQNRKMGGSHRWTRAHNPDPLCFYRALARLGQHHLSEQGELYVEINARFGAETVALFEEEGYRKVTLLHDLYQQERFIKAYR